MKTQQRSLEAVEQKGPKATAGGHFGHQGSLRNFLPADSREICPGFMKYSG